MLLSHTQEPPNMPGGDPYNILRWTPEGYTLPYLALRMAWFATR